MLELTGGADPAASETVMLDTGLTHQQMAGLISTTRETFSSAIRRLAASRIVRPQRLRLKILDRGALHNFA
ncbi:MAG TPA: helix-turn-helix domain-containing protein [Chloroflexota bacterium]|nr:helix-turn-helix domain-containing protein [Chloroflexota bacterium]